MSDESSDERAGWMVERFNVLFTVAVLVRRGRLQAAWSRLYKHRWPGETDLNVRLRLHRSIERGLPVDVVFMGTWEDVESFRSDLPEWVERCWVHEVTGEDRCGTRHFCETHGLYYREAPCPRCGGLTSRLGA